MIYVSVQFPLCVCVNAYECLQAFLVFELIKHSVSTEYFQFFLAFSQILAIFEWFWTIHQFQRFLLCGGKVTSWPDYYKAWWCQRHAAEMLFFFNSACGKTNGIKFKAILEEKNFAFCVFDAYKMWKKIQAAFQTVLRCCVEEEKKGGFLTFPDSSTPLFCSPVLVYLLTVREGNSVCNLQRLPISNKSQREENLCCENVSVTTHFPQELNSNYLKGADVCVCVCGGNCGDCYLLQKSLKMGLHRK